MTLDYLTYNYKLFYQEMCLCCLFTIIYSQFNDKLFYLSFLQISTLLIALFLVIFEVHLSASAIFLNFLITKLFSYEQQSHKSPIRRNQ
jgi:hypothetical protein